MRFSHGPNLKDVPGIVLGIAKLRKAPSKTISRVGRYKVSVHNIVDTFH